MEEPQPPYYAVIFTSQLREPASGYNAVANAMEALAAQQRGYLGFTSRREGSQAVSISYWQDRDAIVAWKQHAEHLAAQRQGQAQWYQRYTIEVAKVERRYGFESSHEES